MLESEYIRWQYFVRELRTIFPGEDFDCVFFRQFKHIYRRTDDGILERRIRIGDVAAYIAKRLQEMKQEDTEG